MASTEINVVADGEATGIPVDDGALDLTINLEQGEPYCANCGQPIAHYADGYPFTGGWAHDKAVGPAELCGPYDFDDVREQAELDADEELTREIVVEQNFDLAEPDQHEPPFEFAHWIGATVRDGQVSVQISVRPHDPRGTFDMVLWRGHDADGKPCLFLRVPNPADPSPHAKLTPLGDKLPGTYIVG